MEILYKEDKHRSLDFIMVKNKIYNKGKKCWLYGEENERARKLDGYLKNAMVQLMIMNREKRKMPKLKGILTSAINKKMANIRAARKQEGIPLNVFLESLGQTRLSDIKFRSCYHKL